MKYLILLLILSISFLSCQSKKEKLLKRVIQRYEERAIQNKEALSIEEVKVIDITIVDQFTVDTFFINKHRLVIWYIEKGIESSEEIIDLTKERIVLMEEDINAGYDRWGWIEDLEIERISLREKEKDIKLLKERMRTKKNDIQDIMEWSQDEERSKYQYYQVDYYFLGKCGDNVIDDTLKLFFDYPL